MTVIQASLGIFLVLIILFQFAVCEIGTPCNTTENCIPDKEICNDTNVCDCNIDYIPITTHCVRECSNPPVINNGVVEVIEEQETLTFVAVYTCIGDFVIVTANDQLVCDEFGNWTGQLPECATPPAQDPCTPNPCPTVGETQVDCTTNVSGPGHVCICPEGLKGNGCEITDTPLVCGTRNKRILFENEPDDVERTVCFNKRDLNETAFCYPGDLGEEVVYSFDPSGFDITTEDQVHKFCLTYLNVIPTEPKLCVNITVHDVFDYTYRPWLNSSVEMCFIFNKKPTIRPIPEDLRFNVIEMAAEENVTMDAAGPEENQTFTWTVNAYPEDLSSFFTVNDQTLTITNPISTYSEPTDLIYNSPTIIELTALDNGVPALENSRNFTVKFKNFNFTCVSDQSIYYLHLIPSPAVLTPLGVIQCTLNGLPESNIDFNITSNPGPVLITTDGEIKYDPSTEDNQGAFSISVDINTAVLDFNLTAEVTIAVLADELQPVCTPVSNVSFSEKADIDSCSEVISTCTDADEFMKTCTDTSADFYVSCNTTENNIVEIKVCVKESIEFRGGSTDVVTITVSNDYGEVVVSPNVEIENINDPPVLQGTSPIIINKSEDTPINEVIYVIAIDDPDMGPDPPLDSLFATLTDLEPSGNNLPFEVNMSSFGNSVSLILSDSLKESSRRFYSMQIKVEDEAGLFDTIDIELTVDDINDSPECNPEYIAVQATVRDNVGDVITQLTCSDPDYNETFKTIGYSLQENTEESYFSIDDSGVIKLANSLLEFTNGVLLVLNINVTDGGGLSTTVQVDVNVTSNYPPECEVNAVTDIISEEATSNNCSDIAIPCVDAVNNTGELQFITQSGNGSERFTLQSNVLNNQQLTFCPAAPLQGFVGTYIFVGVIRSQYGDTDLQVKIEVEDINEVPQCTVEEITQTLNVTHPLGLVQQLTCIDVDIVPDFNVISYSITGVTGGYFSISSTGELSLSQALIDVTTPGTQFTFDIDVSDNGGLTLSIPVTITINTDFPPTCDLYELNATLSETTIVGDCLDLENICVDNVNDETLVHYVVGGNGWQYFDVNSETSTNSVLSVCTVGSLQGNHGTWQLEVIVSSSYGNSTVTVSIQVTDQNEPPQFLNAPFSLNITEDANINTVLYTITAVDPDTGLLGQITYHSTDIDNSDKFSLDENAGTIQLLSPLDAETSVSESFGIMVKDGGTPQLSASTTLTLTIIDVNDNKALCTETSDPVLINVLADIGTLVYTLDCVDADISEDFSQVEYSTTSELFSVDNTGNVTLSNTLPRDQTSHVIDILVQDPDKPNDDNFRTNIQINVNVDTNAPPVCDSTIITLELNETETVGKCVGKEVLCVDPTDVEVTLQDQSGTALQLFEIRTHTNTGALGLNACILNSLKDQFNTYQLIGTVSNGLGTATVQWTITVKNVNEPPVFTNGPYNVDIPETEKNLLKPVLVLSVTDPDNGKGDLQFELDPQSITAAVTNDDDYNGQITDAFLIVPSVVGLSFYAIGNLNATVRDLYVFAVQATDNSGLITKANVVINVTDVNSLPICEPTTITANTDILATVGTEITSLFCYDTDLYPDNVALNYQISELDQYFDVTTEGVIVVASELPRDLLYGTGQARLTVVTSDSGNPPLSTTVSVDISVNNAIAVECTVGITPPSIWVISSCVDITMDCVDPTLDGTDHLTFVASGNYTTGFSLDSNTGGILRLCYLRTTSGIYQISITANNGLKSITYTEVIVVSYSQANPVFTQSKYTAIVNENTEAGVPVLSVSASSSNLAGELVYRVLEASSSEDWSTYLTLDSSSGDITTLQPLKDKANTVLILKVEAEDTGSALKSSVQVEITVRDLNEPPTCGVTSTNLNNIDVNVAVGTQIVLFMCSDPDVKEEYKTLTYTLSGASVSTYFELVGDPPQGIAVKEPLNVLTQNYLIVLTVEDAGTPPLSVIKEFEVTVSLLPPPVSVTVTSKTHESIEVEFSYDRAEFYSVTQHFKVKALTTNNVLVQESGDLQNVAQRYNITGLQAKTPYNIVIQAVTQFDPPIRESDTLVVITREVPVLTYITVTFILQNLDFNTRLRDEGSQLYYTYRQNVVNNLEVVLSADKGYAGVPSLTFRPWNSVAVDAVIALNQTADINATMDTLEQTVNSGWLNDLSVNSSYFIGSYGAGYISISPITQSEPEIYNGTIVTLGCHIQTIGYQATEIFTYWWTYNGNQIQPTDQSRYSITTTAETLLYENKLSLLEIDPMFSNHAGLYGCHVQDSNERTSKSILSVNVIGQPVVIVEPKSQTVNYGDTVTITCTLVYSPGIFDRFIWTRNGQPYVKANNEEHTDGDSSSTIIINGITEQVVTLECQGVNQAGASVPAISSISAISPDDVICLEELDDRGTIWPKTAPGGIVRFNCGNGFTGERYRACNKTGRWMLPVYDCVKDEIQTIRDQVNEIKDGASSTDLDTVLDTLKQETVDTDLYEGDLKTSIETLDVVVDITEDTGLDEMVQEVEDVLEIASNLIDVRNKPSWMSLIEDRREGAIDIPRLVENYLDTKLDAIVQGVEDTAYNVKNIFVNVGSGKKDVYSFPDTSASQAPSWVTSSGAGIKIQGEAFKDLSTVHYASSFYRDITPILVKKLERDGEVLDITDMYDLNSDIISFQLKEKITTISPPAEITFPHMSSNYSNPICCYWDFDAGAFLTDGCELVSTNDEVTVCACNHFTNFAVLMSPGKTPEADVMALSIISAVGCGISIICLVLTIILYLIVWRYVKSDRAILLLNLCVALIISYIVFLAGVNRVENTTLCTVISAMLHYFYLVVFFLMLAYGIEIAVCVVYVFVTRSRIRWLLPLAWGIPLVIVGISLAVTELDGYGNERFCWLSTDDGLLWAFVGPAALIILINFVIVVIVLRQMFKSSAMMTKSDKEKATTGVRSICVLLPILGLTWVFGIFSVNENLVVFQYIFAICNTLQGLLIFLFHCILNKPLRTALKQRSEKRRSMASIENTFKNQQSTTSSSQAFYSSDTKSTQPKNNIDTETTESSNPFLQADRQMKELVAKNKTGANINEVNNKLDKDKPNKAVDLEDVKISNILRESEVMGGTTGISSILQDQPKDDHPSPRDTKASSHRYDYIDPYGFDKSATHSTGHNSAKNSEHSDRSRERNRELERERERERLKQLEYEKRDKQERERKEREKREREKLERDRERDRERERKEREKEKQKNKNVVKIGYSGGDTYLGSGDVRGRDHSHERRDHSHERRGQHRGQYGPSRADDDYEGNISSISTALPEKFDLYPGHKRQKEAKKQADSLQKKKDKKKSSLKDRSAHYEYSYDSTYLGGGSRHASLENMSMQHYAYSPYAQMPGMGGYQTGRPTHQQQHWDQYRYPRDPRDPYGRDYW
ncbi:hypothetical protein ACF0H5_007310 [Mactra antiquata]